MLLFVEYVMLIKICRQDLLPTRLQNAAGSPNTGIFYPPGFIAPQGAPVAQKDLSTMTGESHVTGQLS